MNHAGDHDRKQNNQENYAQVMQPVGETKSDQIKQRGRAAHEDMRRMGKNGAALDGFGRQASSDNPNQNKRDHQLRVLDHANMQVHLLLQQKPAQIRNQNVAETANGDGGKNPHQKRFPNFPFVGPKHRRNGDGAKQQVRGMQKVE